MKTVVFVASVVLGAAGLAGAQQPKGATDQAGTTSQIGTFDMGKIVVIGTPDGQPAVGGAVLSSEQMWTFDFQRLGDRLELRARLENVFDVRYPAVAMPEGPE